MASLAVPKSPSPVPPGSLPVLPTILAKYEFYNFATFSILTTRSLLDKDSQPLADKEALERHIERALSVTAPSGRDVDINYRIIKSYFNPLVVGAENIPDEPCLFVGNHSLFALDGIVAAPIFLKEFNRFPRALGDRFLFGNRSVADQLLRGGAVLGHPDVCAALMEDGQDVLVFPGGAYEAVKPVSELYELHWKERLGFVKLAALHGYTGCCQLKSAKLIESMHEYIQASSISTRYY